MKPKEAQVTALKWKVGYLNEELSVTKAKMSRMAIDDATQQQKEKAEESIQGTSSATAWEHAPCSI